MRMLSARLLRPTAVSFLAGYSDIFLQEFDGWLVKTDDQGNIQWQNLYFGTEPIGSNEVILNDII